MIEEKLQATVENRPLGQVIVIHHHQHRTARLKAQHQLIEQTVQPLLERKRLMALAQPQQPHGLLTQLWEKLLQAAEDALKKAPRIAVALTQAQPQALPMARQRLAKLNGQGAFAKTRRSADQQQPPIQAG